MQTIPIPQIDGRHANPLPSFLALVVSPHLVEPKASHVRRALAAKARVDEKGDEILARHEIVVCFTAEFAGDAMCKAVEGTPAAQVAGAWRFKV